ncbi:hypothetical protein V6S02_09120 [Microbacterium sp. CCNWLW134]|uniref:hypothetical protein n=1 Tax=Microbacterium sp. CCNWLW134 TaxID=3122064 RepID=UPI003010125D
MYARTVRLLKHWNRQNGQSLCSWNIKALALYCVTSKEALVTSMRSWFSYAIEELKKGETEDSACVADKLIKLNALRPEVIKKLEGALSKLDKAIMYDLAGYPVLAQEELSDLFNDPEMMPTPSRVAVLGYAWQRWLARADARAVMYSEALRAVEDYAEAPFIVQRRSGMDARAVVATQIS